MKVICEGIDLSEAVFKVIKACASRTTVPVMECIKISAKNDTVTFTATDGEIAIQKSIKAEVCEEGDICVPGRFFGDFIKKLEGVQITLASENAKLDIIYADSQTSMQILPADDFPKIDVDVNENTVVLNTAEFKRLVSATSFCCASDDSRPILKGCQIIISGGNICVTALDGFRRKERFGYNVFFLYKVAVIEAGSYNRVFHAHKQNSPLYFQLRFAVGGKHLLYFV